MKGKEWLVGILVALIVPWLMFRVAEEMVAARKEDDLPEVSVTETVPPTEAEGHTVSVLLEDGTVEEMELDRYLTGVLLAEMPADFDMEALKAQAVVARTYTLKNKKHDTAQICTDPSCCQAFSTDSAYLAAGHKPEDLQKIKAAVTDTRDRVVTYQGQLIDATYFSCSGGRTEDALAVWGTDVPYLQAVDSPGEEGAAHYIDTVQFPLDEFAALLQTELSGNPETWFGTVTYTDGGGVENMQICGSVYTGTQLRQLLGLRSTAFVMTAVGNTVTVTTKGFGHRVGMSQYGADAMAVAGSTWQEILLHYYPGTEITNYAF